MEQSGASARELALVRRSLAGEPESFGELVELYKGAVYNVAYRMLGNAADAEDASQEAFVRAYTQLDSYDPGRKFSTWLLAITSHLCIDMLRRRRFKLIPLEDLPLIGGWFDEQAEDPEEETLAHETRDEVWALLKGLPPRYRLLLVLRHWHDLSYEEIGEVTRMSESAVKTNLFRARRMLAQRMERKEAERVLSNCL